MPQPIVFSIQENLAYFREKLDAGEVQYKRLAIEHENLKQAVRDGLRFEETVQKSAELTISIKHFIHDFGYWQQWLSIQQSVVEHCHNCGLKELECLTLMQLGVSQYQHGFVDQAIETLHRAEVIATLSEKQIDLYRIRFHLAAAHLCQQNYRQANDIVEKLLAEMSRSDDVSLWRAALNLSGILSLEVGNFAQAEQTFETLTSYLEAENASSMKVAQMLINWGQALREQRKFVSSEQKIMHGISLLSSLDYTIYHVRLSLALIYLYFAQENYVAAAVEIKQISIAYLRNDEQLDVLAEVRYCMARIAWKMGRAGEAIKQVGQALATWQSLGKRLMYARALGLLGQILAGENVPIGLSKITEAIETLAEYPDSYSAMESHAILCTVHHQITELS